MFSFECSCYCIFLCNYLLSSMFFIFRSIFVSIIALFLLLIVSLSLLEIFCIFFRFENHYFIYNISCDENATDDVTYGHEWNGNRSNSENYFIIMEPRTHDLATLSKHFHNSDSGCSLQLAAYEKTNLEAFAYQVRHTCRMPTSAENIGNIISFSFGTLYNK